MASPIESLPAELLDIMIGQLSYTDLARLIQCSKHLHDPIEPVLYASQTALDKAMFWGCKHGKLPTIRLAISYGADVSIVHVPRQAPHYFPFDDKVPVLTLHLAARSHHVDAFALLLELGARVHESADAYQLKHLIRRLSLSKFLLDPFLEAGLGYQLTERLDLKISLVSVIQSGGSIGVVRQLLENGANARMPSPVSSQAFATPLTAAIGANSISLFDFFIKMGVDIHAGDVHAVSYPVKPLHIPVFAAARAMAKHGSEMMQRCLDLGADINHRYLRLAGSPYHDYDNNGFANTPLLVFLDAIEVWKSPMRLRPADGLAFLVKHHADAKFGMLPPVEFLLDKWGLKKLAQPEFFATISFLVENGASKFNTTGILTKYDSKSRHSRLRLRRGRGTDHYSVIVNDKVVHAWGRFVDRLLKYSEEPVTIDALLRHYLREKKELGRLERCTVDCLLKAGANINAVSQPRGATILHDLAYAATCEASGMSMSTAPGVMLSNLAFFIDRGADPTIVVEGRTALDILLETIARRRILEVRWKGTKLIGLGDSVRSKVILDGRERNLMALATLLEEKMGLY